MYAKPVLCFLSGEPVVDKYTIVYPDTLDPASQRVMYLAANDHPFHPQGFGQHGEMPLANVTPEVLGKPIPFTALPPDVQEAVQQDLENT